MNPEVRLLLAELYSQGLAHDAATDERHRKHLNLDPGTAELVALLVRSSRRRRVLEIGTSTGYSTIWLASAVAPVHGRVWSIERDPDRRVQAEANVNRAGLRHHVEVLVGEATEVVGALDGPFDFVFFDGDRVSAPDQLRLLEPKLAPDVMVAADNAYSHPEEMAVYFAAIEQLADFEHLVVPIGKGLSLAYRQGIRH